MININDRTINYNLITTFLFSKVFNIHVVNDKQTTNNLHMSIFSSQWNLFLNVLTVA